jgi:hypothetical protein
VSSGILMPDWAQAPGRWQHLSGGCQWSRHPQQCFVKLLLVACNDNGRYGQSLEASSSDLREFAGLFDEPGRRKSSGTTIIVVRTSSRNVVSARVAYWMTTPHLPKVTQPSGLQ